MTAIKDLLCRTRYFKELGSGQLDEVASSTRVVSIDQNCLLFSRGDVADAAYVVVSGEIVIEIISEQGRSIRVATLGPGDLFGEFAVMDGLGRTADARAQVACTLLKISKSAWLHMFASEPAFSLEIAKDVISKLRLTNLQIEDLSLFPLNMRVAKMLLALSEGQSTPISTIITTQRELADRLVSSREKVNASLQELKRKKAIGISRGKIEILEREKLKRIAGQSAHRHDAI
ncbi:Crp/Fnr family transcriptional regulator [Hyphomonas sp.]|uniref:Crp/Fnr family transcriptional regulator n=1 Tax=Hyphomonas sp. TaxID=87 RepID=UPI000E0403D9|nr:Crp/Fnr family transcriptional regulator [Hyphomonas sp.]RCL90152.1 MAG: Crp/Fnr family transcriptional regulator [Hyphomonas sp.]